MTEDALGPANPDERVEVSVILKPRRSLDELETHIGRPMSREEFAASYGADPSAIARVAAFAREHGLEVSEVSLERRTVKLAGRAADMETAFGVQLSQVRRPDGTFRATDRQPQLPPGLAESVTGVFGLDTRPIARREVSD